MRILKEDNSTDVVQQPKMPDHQDKLKASDDWNCKGTHSHNDETTGRKYLFIAGQGKLKA